MFLDPSRRLRQQIQETEQLRQAIDARVGLRIAVLQVQMATRRRPLQWVTAASGIVVRLLRCRHSAVKSMPPLTSIITQLPRMFLDLAMKRFPWGKSR